MDDAFLVRRLEAGGDLDGNLEALSRIQTR
jgi:hypothetical protein